MTIKEATIQMLSNIRVSLINNGNYKIKDKEIAKKLELTPASYSRLVTGVTTPKAQTLMKIILIHNQYCGDQVTKEIIKKCVLIQSQYLTNAD